jgi:methyl-accepting chemotaxis protein
MKLTIGRKIILGYSVALLIMAAIGVTAYRSTERLIDNASWVAHTHQVLGEVDDLLTKLADAENAARGYILTGEEKYLEPLEAMGTMARSRKALREFTADNPVQQQRLDVIEPMIDRKIAFMREMIDQRRKMGLQGALRMMQTDKGLQFATEIRNTLAALCDEEWRLLRERDRQAKDSASTTTAVILYGNLLGFVFICIVTVLIHRSIIRPLSEFQEFVTAVGAGDLTRQSTLASGDELGKLAKGLNGMVSGLREVAAQTRAATENLNAAAAEILASAKQQSVSAGEQAAACQETTATMQQVRQSCLQIAERAKQVAATAEAVSVGSNSGTEAVQKTNESVESIREQAETMAANVVSLSEKTQMVGEIVATVNDIAEQSHLLALNAAIEAAAAGEHGRSFSVVAGEIKNLADQSKEATIQVKTILGDIQKGINTSVMLTEEAVKRAGVGKQRADLAASTIREMTANIDESVQAFQQIMAGTNQQQIGFEHVMQAVKDISQGSQQSAASTRQMERAAADLGALGQQLRKATDRYQL